MYVNLDVSQYEDGVRDLDVYLYDSSGNSIDFSYAAGSTEANRQFAKWWIILVFSINGA